MIKIEKVDTWGFGHAIRGMRNPMNSWSKSDSHMCFGIGTERCGYMSRCQENSCYDIGDRDLGLMQSLYNGGAEHRKYLRQIFVSADITAPLYWWKEFDTYKVGTVANSCSTMHKIASKPFSIDDFSHDHMTPSALEFMQMIVRQLEEVRLKYIESKQSTDWYDMIQLLPSSYNQMRTVTMNYENVVNIIHQRSGHRLCEWNELVAELKKLPWLNEIMKME